MFMLTSGKKIMKIWLLLKPGQNKKGQKKIFGPPYFVTALVLYLVIYSTLFKF